MHPSDDQVHALRVLDETGGFGGPDMGQTPRQARQGAGHGARTLPAATMARAAAHTPPATARWKNAGKQLAPESMNTDGTGGAKTLSNLVQVHAKKKQGPARSLKKMGSRRKVNPLSPSKPTRWTDVLIAASNAEENSEWNDLLAGVGFGDTMQRLSSYYQNNAILAGLLAAILFDTMSGGRLFDLQRGTLSCPVTGTESCLLTRAQYEPNQLEISHNVFYISGYGGLIFLMCIIIVCVVADNGLKTVSTEEELKSFMSVFSFVQIWLALALYMSIIFLGFHFAALILVHMYFNYQSMAPVGASLVVPCCIVFMSRTGRVFTKQQKVIKAEKERMKAAASGSALPKPKQISMKLKKATSMVKKGEMSMEDVSEV